VAEVPPRRAAPGDAKGRAGAASVDADQLDGLFSQLPGSLFGHAVAALVVLVLFRAKVAPPLLWAWTALFLLSLGWRANLARQYVRARHQDRMDALALWQRRWDWSVLGSGALWSLGVALFYLAGGTLDRLVLFLVVSGTSIGSPANRYRVFLAYALLCFVPMVGLVAWEDWPAGLPLASVALIAFMGTALIGARYHRLFSQMVALKTRHGLLAQQLTREKSVVEEARHQAEQARGAAEAAMRAKTDFFAAANHDLRQPLHAIVLFSQALSQRQIDAESSELCARMVDSVAVLEGLFNELLDLHRIDSGKLELRPQDFYLRDLYARLALHLKPEAFDKGLELKFLGGDRVVRADPVLLERILRNLVANALRYTEDGGVLVTCRGRGQEVLLQVWDTGIGIRAEALPRIYDEFYQIDGDRRLAPQHRKGAGLGLAIVRRLAALMQARIQARSAVGRGTVFDLWLPAGRPDLVTLGDGLGMVAVRVTLEGARVVAVEDDPAVLQAVEALLRLWGARVIGFDSLAAVQAWAGTAAPEDEPDLLLVDHGLPEGHTGREVILALRQRFARDLPAIVISGAWAQAEADCADLPDCHLLSKPVAPNRLRALVSAKLAPRPSQLSPRD